MNVYYGNDADNSESVERIELSGQRFNGGFGSPDQIILGIKSFDTDSMMSNPDLNHLNHAIEMNAPMFINQSDADGCYKSDDMIEIQGVNIVTEMQCLKQVYSLIVFQLKQKD